MKCGNEFFEKYSKWSNGNFCSKSCARSYSQSQMLSGIKISKCTICGKEIEVNKRSSGEKCDDCRSYNKKRRCNQCGQEICNKPNICAKGKFFKTLITYFGFNGNSIGTLNLYKEYDRIKCILENQYHDLKMSTLDLEKFYILPKNLNMYLILKQLGISTRNWSAAASNAIITKKLSLPHKSNIYKCGWHTTWDNNKVFYRSSYELNYCEELDKKFIKYDVENIRIAYWDSQLCKYRIAIPDFYIPIENRIVEIKSKYTLDENNMKDKIIEYKKLGYNFTLLLEGKEKIL